MDADVDQARFDELFVERIHQLLVVQSVGMLGQMFVGIIPMVYPGFNFSIASSTLSSQPGHPDVKISMRERTLRAGLLVDLCTRLILHLVCEEPIEGLF
jgi:hypothetical protein